MAPSPEQSLPPPPTVSVKTIHMAGLLVDVYGLQELAPSASRVSCLWLHHPRTRSKDNMADIAARCVAAWNENAAHTESHQQHRGLIALAFDQRNHGTRLVHDPANGSWREGNATHAQDMFGIVAGAVADQTVLLDAVAGYLFHDDGDNDDVRNRVVDHHLALGVSLGGHSVWQLMFADPRVRAGVVVIGCPDYMNLISDRAKKSRLSTYSAEDGGASFIGSKDFPPALVAASQKFDPKGILFGTSDVPKPNNAADNDRGSTRQILHDRLRDKRFLLCSGGDDKLVPYQCSEPFLQWFIPATESLFKEENISVDDRVYPGIGHTFSAGMVRDAVQFVTEVVASADSNNSDIKDEQRASKI
ncbi:hypothetical protein B0T17DRAFT_612069 [Bombardia bombarda]|uniref:Uncharacterized protein n=1 Tax=Bombardia bombarda TaxID=252184 RepID=A0AA39XKU3_9PEZI|nr:hypothetical protein B0T17DRAFT_612069 [Bombardia bombarda]